MVIPWILTYVPLYFCYSYIGLLSVDYTTLFFIQPFAI